MFGQDIKLFISSTLILPSMKKITEFEKRDRALYFKEDANETFVKQHNDAVIDAVIKKHFPSMGEWIAPQIIPTTSKHADVYGV